MSGSAPSRAQSPFVIGLTGPIGCGKSTIARMLAELGATVIDADALARQASARDQPTLPVIRARFGDEVFGPDGALHRAALGAVVFADPDALMDLEAILHPPVRALVNRELERAVESGAPLVVIEAIKLIEGGLAARCHEVWLIECGTGSQRDRLCGRGLHEEEIERRVTAQGPDLAKRLAAGATRRITSDGPLEQTRERVEDALADALAPLLLGSPTESERSAKAPPVAPDTRPGQ